MNITIRPMLPGDYDQVRAVWEAAGLRVRRQGRDTAAAIARQLAHFPATYLVARHDERVVGVVLGTHDQRKGWINRLAVHPDFQCRGIARQLVAACEDALRAAGIEVIGALVEGDNPASPALLRQAGYHQLRPISYFRKAPDAEA